MSNLTLDGSTSFIGTEFIKLLATGSSNLATEEYVDDAIEQNGGGGGNVDLTNYYNKSETDGLLNNKLNVNNPQDIIGNLRLDPTNGNAKLIVNAVGAPNDEDFYVNGLSNLGGTLKAQLIQASSNIETSQQIKSNTINTYSNSNMIIQRNAIPFITLDSQIVDSQTVEKIILMKDVEFSGGLSLNTLSVDTLNTIGLNDMVFNINTLGEILRFEVGGTVRVPNNRSFISQNIFTDIIKPLTFSNDVVFNGGNSTNDAYEEYVRLDASTEKVNISKETKFENAIQLNQGQSIKWTNVFIREVQGATRPEFDLIVNGSTSHLRLWVNGAIKQAITNTTIACKVNIDAEQGLTVFTGQQLKTNTINSHTNSNLVLQRSGSTLITLNSSNQVQLSGDLVLPTPNTQYIRFNNCKIREGLAGVISYFDFINEDTAGHFRFYLGEIDNANLKISIQPNIINLFNETVVNQKLQIINGYGLESNLIDTNGDNNLVFQRNGSPYITFNSDRININQALHLADTLFIDTVNKLSLKPSLESGVNIFDIRNLHPVVDNPMIRFRVGEGGGETIICEMTNNGVSIARNLVVGTAYELRSNTINTNGDIDLVFKRNGVEYFRLDDLTGTDILNVANDKGVSASYVFGNRFWNRSFSSDTTFFGSNVAGDDRVEYMRWNYLSQSVDYNAPIDNTGLAITGNIIDTTVSDERLKTNIEDVDTDFTSCIKNVKVKTFKYKDDKYKTNDTYGFIAQELKEHLPKECKNIVKENKVKNEDETFLSINYMKLSVVLWKALQEEINKREHIESRLFELEDIVKEMRGKKTTKPKAKAKSKTKVEK